jgi:DNA-binding transcriptional LysR family regulator
MDRLEAMSVLIAAVEAGSLSAASRRLGSPLPTVSRKISELEARLNTRLLIRSTRRLTLTDSGTAYVAACKRILDQVGDAERAASGEYEAPKGELVVTAPVVFGRLHVLPLLNAFLKEFPDVNVRLVLSDRIAHLFDDHIDLAVRIGALPDSSLVATRAGVVRRVVCGSPDYFAGHGVPKRLEDLSSLAAITFDIVESTRSWDFAEPGSRALRTVPIRPRMSVNTAESAIDAAIAGVGVTRVLSYQVARAVEAGTLQCVLRKFEPEPVPVNLIHGGQGLLPLKVRRFLDFVIPRLREILIREESTAPKARKA